MRSRVVASSVAYDNGEIVVDAGRDNGGVATGSFFAFCDEFDGHILSIWRAVQVKSTISMFECIWMTGVQTRRLEIGSVLQRMDVVEFRARKERVRAEKDPISGKSVKK